MFNRFSQLMKSKLALAICCAFLLTPSAFCQEQEDGFVPLFNGESLEGWKSARSTGDDDWGPFSVNEEEKAIHVYAGKEANSKQKTDCLNTVDQYSHFILKLEYKWLENRFAPRTEYERDAGLLFHVHGDLTKVWPSSLEMQIGESAADKKHSRGKNGRFHTGDLFVLRKDLRTTTTLNEDKKYAADGKPRVGRSIETYLGTEKPKGEWNEIELHVHGSEKATFMLNGEVVLVTTDFHTVDEEGNKKEALSKGHIGFQAEWAELMYRNIRIKDLSSEVDAESEADATSEKAAGSEMKSPTPASGSGIK